MSLTQTTTPSAVTEPIDLVYLKDHIRVDFEDDDDLLTDMITEAREQAEAMIDGIIADRAFSWTLDRFPAHGIELPLRPIDPTTISISYQDTDDATQSFTTFRYVSDLFKTTIYPNDGTQWPATVSGYDKVTITFTAGFSGANGFIPAAVKRAIALIVSSMNEYRSNETQQSLNPIPFSAGGFLERYKKTSY